MSDVALSGALPGGASSPSSKPNLDHGSNLITTLIFLALLAGGLFFTAYSLYQDISAAGMPVTTWLPFLLLGVALLIALGFEFVNGFHDTANAVATVIYTHSMPANVAVLWSGFFNFLGVLLSTGAVAFGIISLLPVELILQVGSSAGFAMVFALLIAAIIWNLGTWWLGIPSSSSHTLIGSIIGVGVANSLMRGGNGTSGVDWGKAQEIGMSLLISPLVGFFFAAALLLILKFIIRNPALYKEPVGNQPPPWWIRGLLILTCTGVSFAHGSNDGQKGMGLIMLILIGTVPMAYALNRAPGPSHIAEFKMTAAAAAKVIDKQASGYNVLGDPRPAVESYISARTINEGTYPSLAALVRNISEQVDGYGSLDKVPAAAVSNVRNDMYLSSEALRLLLKDKANNLSSGEVTELKAFKGSLDGATRFIPLWVKVAVAIALGLGTMIGWKRIVVTVGEKIGKTHLTYAQGASAELVAMATIGAADAYGLPVSTTHVLSSGVAGTMAANGSGLQWATVRSLLLAWVLTLPVSILLAGGLYVLFAKIF
ncbi:inorganic phosphate transporter [Hyphomicrobium sp.]|jgi:PiT family inorganic phosphate transporter|uniref:inorganic phosphate transporter n=1 Tax=Hyphomicrobium sp. TaxID=82 RepID=UPI003565B1F4